MTLLTTFLLNSPNAAEIVNQLFPNLWIFIAHTLASISLLFMLSKWVYEPFKKSMRARRNNIKAILIDANEKKIEAEDKLLISNKKLLDVNFEAKNIINEAKELANLQKEQIIRNANEESKKIINNTKSNIVILNKNNQEYIKKTIKNMSIQIAQDIIKKELNEKNHLDIINTFIDKIKLNEDDDE